MGTASKSRAYCKPVSVTSGGVIGRYRHVSLHLFIAYRTVLAYTSGALRVVIDCASASLKRQLLNERIGSNIAVIFILLVLLCIRTSYLNAYLQIAAHLALRNELSNLIGMHSLFTVCNYLYFTPIIIELNFYCERILSTCGRIADNFFMLYSFCFLWFKDG